MARSGVDYKEFEKLFKQLKGKENDVSVFMEGCAKELTARLLANVIPRTPTGVYDKKSGKKGGTLRRGWTGGKTSSGANYANSLNVGRSGSIYTIEIVNPVEYASYVEFGHRTRGGDGWVDGKFILTVAEDEISRNAPQILERKIQARLKECFE